MKNDRRPAKTGGLIASLILAPALAGLIGGLLVFLGTLPLVFGNGYSAGGEGSLLTGVIATSIIAILVGVLFTYVIGGPFILAGWAAAHFLTTRRTIHFAVFLAIAGACFSYILFGGFLRQIDQTQTLPDVFLVIAPIGSGAVAGLCVGAVISALGYGQAPQPHGADGAG